MIKRLPSSLFPLFFFLFSLFSLPAIDFNTPQLLAPYIAQPPEIASRSAVLIDAETGTVLYSKKPHEEIPPASLAKLMTIHLVLNEIDAGKASFDELIPIGRESWSQSQPLRSSLMFLAPGQTVTLKEILLGLAVSSGNDAAVAAALRLAPSTADFAAMMTAEARRLGMVKTLFVEPSGISENNSTTAAEMAMFCQEYIRLHPNALADLHSVAEFAYPREENVSEVFRVRPNTIVQANRNNLLKTFPGVDGLKTGYIDEAGYNIAVTAERNNTRFIAVIMGAPAAPGGDRIRDRDSEKLLAWAFENFKTIRPAIDPVKPVKLWKGREKNVTLRPLEPLSFTAPSGRAGMLQYSVIINEPLIAPLPADYPSGWVVFSDGSGELHRVRLYTAKAYRQGSIFVRLWHSIRLFFS